MTYRVIALPGGGIGSEVLNGSLELLEIVGRRYNFIYNSKSYDFGRVAIGAHGIPSPSKTPPVCQKADAILLGATGGPKWVDPNNRPEQRLLVLHKKLSLFADIRPVKVTKGTSQFSPSKEAHIKCTDSVVVRELTSGIYFGKPRHIDHSGALDSLIYTRAEVERIAKVIFELVRTRNKKVAPADEEDILVSGKLWRKIVTGVSKSYPDIGLNHLLVDACSVHSVTRPPQFDVIVTENLFGSILSGEASVISGSLGLPSSASPSGYDTRLYESACGSAPDVANRNLTNPFGMVLSPAMRLKESPNQSVAAEELEDAIYHLIKVGKTTKDLGGHYKTSEIFELFKKNYQ